MLAKQPSTATEFLERYPATKWLKKLGFTDELLDQVRFHPKDCNLPIKVRPILLPAALLNARDLRSSESGRLLSFLRDFAIYRYALIDGPAQNCTHIAEAWQHVSEALFASLVDDRLRYLDKQRLKAGRPRGCIPEIGMTIRELVIEYVNKPESRELNPKELWPGFGSHMSFLRLDAKLVGNSYEYSIDKSIAYSTFCNYTRDARKKRQRG